MAVAAGDHIHSAEVVLPCGPSIADTLIFFTDTLGFRLELIYPADSPAVAVISGYGVRLRLETGPPCDSIAPSTTLRLNCKSPHTLTKDGALQLTAPNGTCIMLHDVNAPLYIPPIKQSFVLTKLPRKGSSKQQGEVHLHVPSQCEDGSNRQSQVQPSRSESGSKKRKQDEVPTSYAQLEGLPGTEHSGLPSHCQSERNSTTKQGELPSPSKGTSGSTELGWTSGRAGMMYRDLIPDRQGGRFVASHIRIIEGGDIPDYVHYHKVRFQMIYCYKGWVRVAYQDQGEPLMVRAGDCLLQPPEIRHRVLQSAPGTEVIEIGCPADIVTYADHDLSLPNSSVDRLRKFGGQRFVHHQVAMATWSRCPVKGSSGFEYRDLGIAKATDNLAGVRVIRVAGNESHDLQNGSRDLQNGSHDLHNGSHDVHNGTSTIPNGTNGLQNGSHDFKGASHDYNHNGEFLFVFILKGEATLSSSPAHTPHDRDCVIEEAVCMVSGDCCVIPAGVGVSLIAESADLEYLEVTLPASV